MHSGHRERMRERIEKHGLDSLLDHEVLEVLLYYTQPRVNTNQQAHLLLERFGSLSNVLDADVDDLMEVKGIGPKSAAFLSLLPQISRRYLMDHSQHKGVALSLTEINKFAQTLFVGSTEEQAYLILLDKNFSLISAELLSEGNYRAVYINRKKAIQIAVKKNAFYVVLAHNHPGNDPSPSAADQQLTISLKDGFEDVGMLLLDHIIVCPNGKFYNFSRSGLL